MWGWDSICSAARKIDKRVREDAPVKLKQYTPEKQQLHHVFRYVTGSFSGRYSTIEIPKMTWVNWHSISSIPGKIDKTVRVDALSKFGYVPDPRVFWPRVGQIAMEEMIRASGIPGLPLLYKCLKGGHIRSSPNGGLSGQLHGQGLENGERMSTHERERAEGGASDAATVSCTDETFANPSHLENK